VAKTYVPTVVTDVHSLAVFITKNRSTLRIAITVLDPAALPVFDAMCTGILAFDALRDELYPIAP